MWDDPETAGYVDVEGGRAWWRINGLAHRDKAALVCIAGGPGMSHHYMTPFLALADERPVVLYDQLDTGNADRPNDPANWHIARFVDEIARLRSALDIDRVVLVGNSWGALVALECWFSGADGIEALVLSSPVVSIRRWEADAKELVAALPDDIKAIIAEAERTGNFATDDYSRAIGAYSRRHICRLDPRPDCVLKSFSVFGSPLYNAMNGPSEFNILGTIRDYEREADLPRIDVAVLFTCGEHDSARPATCRHFASLVPGAEVVEFADASHFTFTEKPDEYMAVVRDFLARKGL